MRTVWSPSGTSNLRALPRKNVGLPAVDEELVLALVQEAEPDSPPLQGLDLEGHLVLVVEEVADDRPAVDGHDGLALLAQDGRRVGGLDLVMPPWTRTRESVPLLSGLRMPKRNPSRA